MFTDPQSVTINGAAKSMPRIQSPSGNKLQSVYTTSDELWSLMIQHQSQGNGRIRTQVNLTQRAVVTNPLDSSNDYDNLVTYLVIDRPGYGFTVTNLDHQLAGFKAWLDSTAITRLFGRES
jgi:hypothetical protein